MSIDVDVAVLTQRVDAQDRAMSQLTADIDRLEGKLDDVKKQNFGIICALLVACVMLVANLVVSGVLQP